MLSLEHPFPWHDAVYPREPRVYRYRYPRANIGLGHTLQTDLYGCHELEVYPDDRLTCGGGVRASLPGQKGHGPGRAGGETRSKSVGLRPRSSATITHRPRTGSRRRRTATRASRPPWPSTNTAR